MIKLDRGDPPEFFLSPEIEDLRAIARGFFGVPAQRRAQSKFDFQKVASRLYPHVRRALKERFPAKCAYCETPLENFDIEAFRPKQRATNLDGKVDDDHYWWLTYEWSNYLPACRQCNVLKGLRFPVRGPRSPIGATGADLAAEHRLLLDPCEDDAASVLLYLDDGRVTSDDERGRTTIDVLGLNREALVGARKADVTTLLALIGTRKPSERQMNAVVGSLTAMTDRSQPFAAMRRQYARAWALEVGATSPRLGRLVSRLVAYNTALESDLQGRHRVINKAARGLNARVKASEAYSITDANVPDSYYSHARFIERFELRNIRAFENLVLRTPIGTGEAGRQWLVLLGENGAGKSTILQALACALVGQEGVRQLPVKATDLLRRGCDSGEIRVHVTGMSEPIVMTLARKGNRITVTPPDPKVMVLGYGATRLLNEGANGAAPTGRIKVENLFDPYVRLSNGRPWLYEVPKRDFDRLARALSALLPRADGATFSRRGGRVYVEMPGVTDTLDTLSSGYQAVLALALDIMSVMRLGWEDMASAEGIVLIDEVDAHLHPRWKMRIVKRLSEVFPRMQFIATSHEPLTLRGLEREEVAVLRRTLDGKVVASAADTAGFPSPRLMRVDQLLVSEFFGLNSTEDLEVDAQFEEYYGLLALQSRTPQEEERLQELRTLLDGGGQLGASPRERLVFEAADQMIADSRTSFQALTPAQQQAAQAHLKAIWAGVQAEPGGEGGQQ